MKINKLILLLFLSIGAFSSCSKDDNDERFPVEPGSEKPGEAPNLEIENYLYDAMSIYYVYEADVPELGENYFDSDTDKEEWLASFDSPEDLFNNGLKVPAPKDRFSFIVADYTILENNQAGIQTTTGMDYGLVRFEENGVLAYVRYVLPGSPADEAGVTRGVLFTDIDGETMTLNNYQSLLGRDGYEITVAEINENTISNTDEIIALNRVEITENPVLLSKVVEVDGISVGYIMYNSFTADFDDELNAAFGELKAEGVDELVLDLRYNGGGSVESAVDLSSMITGQFEGKIFSKQTWNALLQSQFTEEELVDRFNDKIRTEEAINSLGLSKVYIIATGSTASASELVMNGLAPYIDVVHVGEGTVGKFQAAAPLYDSPNFLRQNRNPNHKYVIQPLIYESKNANEDAYYEEGLVPDIEAEEDIVNLLPLGEPEETLLAAALADITGNRMAIPAVSYDSRFTKIGERGDTDVDYQRMYIEEIPEEIRKKAAEFKQ
ncbi:S41 family peptidase [Salegentibacter salegens]|uniref:C-terminal processing protease CtpA/Prc, contains a PDZ domain n=1 Tax=Salegentibacter salegens TaxID=143223 RepID=A0A1M7JDW2_9FLAO|nr:S41 family peptidase [Salegentibacter salegens]PRX42821.1 C-terminal processing protease CtpA/Prc [Salegentibacter salegens]SHM51156.1 C-terminal processing protease CtpA/Prc, contains a PDZ domain [Salegentibacter salegens]